MAELAAIYAYRIINNHPFLDGNKRTGHIYSRMLLLLNNLDIKSPEEERINIFIATANNAQQLRRCRPYYCLLLRPIVIICAIMHHNQWVIMKQHNDTHFSHTSASYMAEVSKPLAQLELDYYCHDITFSGGKASLLSNRPEVFDFYQNNHFPLTCTDESGRTLGPGWHLCQVLEHKLKSCSVLFPILRNQFQLKNWVHIIKREEDHQHMLSFGFNLNEYDFLHMIVNNGQLLNDFIAAYFEKSQCVIDEAMQVDNRICLPTMSSIAPTYLDQFSKEITLKNANNSAPIHLSQQQSKCLIYLFQGMSTKQIANKMNLSARTIEHYLARIRNILGCHSSKELIARYSEQLASAQHNLPFIL